MRFIQVVCESCLDSTEWDWDETVTARGLESTMDTEGWQHIDGRDLCPACAEKEGK